jgi:hypothetical protein
MSCHTKLFFLLALVIPLLTLLSCPSPLDPGAENPHLITLGDLGLDTDIGPATDPDGVPLPDDYNPLGGPCGVFNPLNEIFVAGFSSISGRSQYLIDDLAAGLTPLYSFSDDTWAGSTYKNSVGADVDGDGLEEVVAVYYGNHTLYLKRIDYTGGTYDEYNVSLITGINSGDDPGYFPDCPEYQPALAAGDFDGDGKDELILGFSYHAWVVDDEDAGFAVEHHSYSNSKDLYVAAGDVDGDSRDEFIITYHYSGNAYCDIFDGSFSAPFVSRQDYTLHASNLNCTYAGNVHAAMGDIDGDGLDEIVFHGQSQGSGDLWYLSAMDDARSGFDWLDFLTWTWRSDDVFSYMQYGAYSPALAILDYNGDGLEDIFASLGVFQYDDGSSSGHPASSTNTNIDRLEIVFSDPPKNVWAGDVDGATDDPFRKDEIVYFYDGRFWIGGEDAQGNHQHQSITYGSCSDYSTLCLANVDFDTPVVCYTGNHELLFTDPTIISVLACPPYHADAGQNIGACGTTFGTSTAQGVEESTSTGISVGFSIGYEHEDPFGIVSSSFKLTVEESLDWISSRSSEIEKYISYSSGPDEDKVVFTAIPFDVYYYTIVSSPDPTEVGNPMTINIPRELQTLSVSRTFYNANNGDYPDVDASILNHTIGDVSSYPSVAERNTLIASEGLYSPDSPVGVGTGSITVGVSMTEGQGTGTYSDFSVTVETEVGSGGFTVGASSGFHYGHEYTVTNTQSTFYEGTVGDIDEETYTSGMGYTFGLFTYPDSLGDQSFTVVNYWVE